MNNKRYTPRAFNFFIIQEWNAEYILQVMRSRYNTGNHITSLIPILKVKCRWQNYYWHIIRSLQFSLIVIISFFLFFFLSIIYELFWSDLIPLCPRCHHYRDEMITWGNICIGNFRPYDSLHIALYCRLRDIKHRWLVWLSGRRSGSKPVAYFQEHSYSLVIGCTWSFFR